MDSKSIIQKKINNKLSEELVKWLKIVPDCEDDFILAVLVHAKNDDDKQIIIDYIKKGENVSYEQVLLLSVFLKQQREKKENG